MLPMNWYRRVGVVAMITYFFTLPGKTSKARLVMGTVSSILYTLRRKTKNNFEDGSRKNQAKKEESCLLEILVLFLEEFVSGLDGSLENLPFAGSHQDLLCGTITALGFVPGNWLNNNSLKKRKHGVWMLVQNSRKKEEEKKGTLDFERTFGFFHFWCRYRFSPFSSPITRCFPVGSKNSLLILSSGRLVTSTSIQIKTRRKKKE